MIRKEKSEKKLLEYLELRDCSVCSLHMSHWNTISFNSEQLTLQNHVSMFVKREEKQIQNSVFFFPFPLSKN